MYPQYYIDLALFFQGLGVPESWLALTVTVTMWAIVTIGAGILYWLLTRPVFFLLEKWACRTPTKWDDYIIVPRFGKAVGGIVFAYALLRLLPAATLYYPGSVVFVTKVLKLTLVVAATRGVIVGAGVVYDACERQKIERHGLLVVRNILQTIAVAVAALVMLSIILNQEMAYILTSLGAMAAVLTLVFKDSILGLVAGVKLSINKSLKKGDWIQVPPFGANGEVEDVTLTAIKVRNWDNSIVTVPPYALISGGFQNQQEMKRSGGRRIMRSVLIDLTTVRFLSPEELAAFRAEVWARSVDFSRPVVNLTLFRLFLEEHIKETVGFRADMLNMVRELQPTSEGIPIEIYLFTDNVDWRMFELAQAQLLDFILASVSRFGLRVFQKPSGADLTALSMSADHVINDCCNGK